MRPEAGPLSGLRVVDATSTPDAPVASSLLADAGAEVVVVEPAGGHAARLVGPMKDGTSLLWKATVRNKASMPMPSAGDFDDLLAQSDVLLVEPDFRAPNGHDVAGLVSAHPHLVVVTTSPFGATGPWAGRPGTGRLAEAFGGQTFASGDPARPPLHSGFPIGASATALIAALGTIAAVLERDHSGTGQHVDVAGYEAVLRYMEFLPVFFQQTGFRNERAGNGSSYQVPVATWLTADDKWVTFTGNTNEVVHRLYQAMGRPELIDDPRFATNEGRVANRDVVEKTLSQWARSLARADLEQVCGAHNVPVGSVFTMADIFSDHNYLERGTILTEDDSDLGPMRVPVGVPRFRHTAAAAPAARRKPGRRDGAGPLAGLRVIDIGQILAGPFAATLLADLGADVIKVEKPNGGDDFRRQAPLLEGVSLWWKASARNKLSISLDLKDEDDKATLLRLVATADIVTANFVPGTLERMGLGYDDLLAVNPRIILVSVSGYGQDGPYRTRRAFGRNAEAYGGLSSVTGYADTEPMPTGFPVADGFSATFGAFGALCARYAQSHGGDCCGYEVDVALYETIFRLLELPTRVYDQFGEDPGRSSFGTAAGERMCVARSADGHWMSASRWDVGPVRFDADHPCGIDDAAGWAGEVDGLRQRIEASTADALMAADDEALSGYAIAPVASIDELLASPHAQQRSTIITVDDDELGSIALAPVVPRFSRTPGAVRHAAPKLDEHRHEILQEWIGG